MGLRAASLFLLWLALSSASEIKKGRTRSHGHYVCSTWGNNHFKTFDGDIYQFPGLCEYNFVSDCREAYKEFSVHIQRALNSNSHPEIQYILVKIKDITVYLKPNLVVVDGRIVKTPYYASGVLIESNEIYTKIYAKLGMVLMWNQQDALMVELDSKFNNHTCGLCGDYNGIQIYNEFIKGDTSYNSITYGNMQKISKPNSKCEDPDETQALPSCNEHRDECQRLLTSPAFADCRLRLNLEMYIQACMQDKCACNGKDDSFCLCSTISEYSRQCSHAGGRPGEWRTQSFCPKTCPATMVYSESSSPCMDTCSHLQISSLCEEHYMDGCFCPEGTVYDDISEKGCIPVSQCYCKLGGKTYAPGESISKECEECTCNSGRWTCKDLPCPGTCSVEGGSHFTTFDGKKYTFHGDCYYVLAKGTANESYALLAELAPCGSTDKQTCLKTVVLLVDNKKNVVVFRSDGSVLLNEMTVNVPHVSTSFSVFKPSSNYFVVQTPFGLQMQIQLFRVMQLFVTVDQSVKGKLQGLCGNFNGMEGDDFRTTSGLIEATGSAFANTWKAQSTCTDQVEKLEDPCSLSIESANYAEHWCSLLRNTKGPFARCHIAIDPSEYYKKCKYDTCLCEDNEECLCAALSSYSRACAFKGIILGEWRKSVCSNEASSCPGNQVFLYNLTMCQQTCRSLADGEKYCLQDFAPVDGCGCPTNTYLDNQDNCVPISQCPCYYKGSYLEPGEYFTKDGERCVCRNAKIQCTSVKLRMRSEEECSSSKTYFDCNAFSKWTSQTPLQLSCHTPQSDHFQTECVSGCVCPEGLFDDGRGGCVEQKDCPCIHNNQWYSSGDKIKVDCNTCTCQKGVWKCTEDVCYGTCMIYGSGHYNTFDGKFYDFDGSCEYVATQDFCGDKNSSGSFSIITENVPCGTTGVTCSKAIKMFLGKTELKLENKEYKEIQRDVGDDVQYWNRTVGLYLVIEASNGVMLIWDKKTTVFIKLSPDYKGKVCGLCGNFDDKANNDFTTRSGLQDNNPLNFGNSWKQSPMCPDVTQEIKPCDLKPHRKSWAEKECSIIQSEVFKICHSKVDPLPYYEACVHDACSCDSGGDCECFCSAVAAYAQECIKAEACVFWRTPDICPIFCDYYNPRNECDWHYEPCGSNITTCRMINNVSTNFTVPLLEGCYPRCPKDKPIYNEETKQCVTGDQCGCYLEDGTYIPPWQQVPTDKNCTTCVCVPSGSIECNPVPGCPCVINGTSYEEGATVGVVQDGDICIGYVCAENGSVVPGEVYPCPTSLPTTISTSSPHSTLTTTTTTVSTTSRPVTTTPCIVTELICDWTEWFDVSKPEEGGGDYETYDEIRKHGNKICTAPEKIECRAKDKPDVSLEELGQKVECNVTYGLICKNDEQDVTMWPLCYNYEIRVNCCEWQEIPCEHTTTPTIPSTSTTTQTTIASTTTIRASTEITTTPIDIHSTTSPSPPTPSTPKSTTTPSPETLTTTTSTSTTTTTTTGSTTPTSTTSSTSSPTPTYTTTTPTPGTPSTASPTSEWTTTSTSPETLSSTTTSTSTSTTTSRAPTTTTGSTTLHIPPRTTPSTPSTPQSTAPPLPPETLTTTTSPPSTTTTTTTTTPTTATTVTGSSTSVSTPGSTTPSTPSTPQSTAPPLPPETLTTTTSPPSTTTTTTTTTPTTATTVTGSSTSVSTPGSTTPSTPSTPQSTAPPLPPETLTTTTSPPSTTTTTTTTTPTTATTVTGSSTSVSTPGSTTPSTPSTPQSTAPPLPPETLTTTTSPPSTTTTTTTTTPTTATTVTGSSTSVSTPGSTTPSTPSTPQSTAPPLPPETLTTTTSPPSTTTTTTTTTPTTATTVTGSSTSVSTPGSTTPSTPSTPQSTAPPLPPETLTTTTSPPSTTTTTTTTTPTTATTVTGSSTSVSTPGSTPPSTPSTVSTTAQSTAPPLPPETLTTTASTTMPPSSTTSVSTPSTTPLTESPTPTSTTPSTSTPTPTYTTTTPTPGTPPSTLSTPKSTTTPLPPKTPTTTTSPPSTTTTGPGSTPTISTPQTPPTKTPGPPEPPSTPTPTASETPIITSSTTMPPSSTTSISTPKTTTTTVTGSSTTFSTTSSTSTPVSEWTTTSTSPETLSSTTTSTSTSTTTSRAPTTTTGSTTLHIPPPCECIWTDWIDMTYPDASDRNGGDYETFENIYKNYPSWDCAKVENISCRAEKFPSYSIADLGQKVECNVNVGLICNNKDQQIGGIIPMPVCLNYEISVCCTPNKPECLPIPSTTSTTTSTASPTTNSVSPPISTTAPTSTSVETPSPTTTTTTSTMSPSSTTTSGTTPSTPSTASPTAELPTTSLETPSTTSTSTSTPTTTTTVTGSPTPTSSTSSTSSPTPTYTTTLSTPASSPPTPSTPKSTTTPSPETLTTTTSTSTTTTTTTGSTTPTSTTSSTSSPTPTPTSTTSSTSSPTPTYTTTTSTPGTSLACLFLAPFLPTGTQPPISTTPFTGTGSTTKTTTSGPTPSVSTPPTTTVGTEMSTPTTTSATVTTPTTSPTSTSPVPTTTSGTTPTESFTTTSGTTSSSSITINATTSISTTFKTLPPVSTTTSGPTATSTAVTTTGSSTHSATPPVNGSTTGLTPTTPKKTCTIFPNETYEQGDSWMLCNCTKVICIEDNIVQVIPIICNPPPKPTCANGLSPVPVMDEDGCCWHWECDCYCTGWGDPHYMTFDGLYYSYQGNCTYVLVEEINKKVDNFGVYIDNYHCDARDVVSCPRTLIVRHETQEVRLTTAQPNTLQVEVTVNNQLVALPYKKFGVSIYESGINRVVEIPELKMNVTYNGLSFSIRMPYSLFGNNTQGQCGTCNNNTADDCMLPNGNIAENCETMADHWQVVDPSKPQCSPGLVPTGSPSTAPIQPCKESSICELLLGSVFKPCHAFVQPEKYYAACVFDSCVLPNLDLECSSLQIYAAICADQGACIDWRKHTNGVCCKYECPSGKEYRACGPIKEMTCKSRGQNETSTKQVEGCFCPNGTMLYDSGVDVCVKTCGCVGVDMIPREFGEKFTVDCQDCICLEGEHGIVCEPHVCDQKKVTCDGEGFYEVTEVNPEDSCCPLFTCKCNTSLCTAKAPKCSLGFEVHSYIPTGQCCPVYQCVPKGVCVHENAEFLPNSSVFVDKCQNCVCTNDVNVSTQLNIISCERVPCNTYCQPGYEIKPVKGECCGKCVQTKCIIQTADNSELILSPGDFKNDPHNNCTIYSCVNVHDQLIASTSEITCPAFNEDSCKPGTISFLPNGCCRTCNPGNAEVRGTSGAISPKGLTECEGTCGTFSLYSAEANSMDHSCSCCRETSTTEKHVVLKCPGGHAVSHKYIYVESCSCQDTECKRPVSEELQSN
ncbi:mucin-2 [Geospiza fortis]|uniref:Mucin-2 n=1 Tax=Geospiza fortis TaxID=48883 RepID=A0A8N5HQS6_GEOFO|nr:mucin-2 [Geospiza fortis]